jgi:thioredoxin reductase (NADPH)
MSPGSATCRSARAHALHVLDGITVRDRSSGVVEDVPARLLLVLIGVLPQTDWLAKALERDAQGFVVTGGDVTSDVDRRPLRLETSMPGVFAAGDVRHGSVKRVASAVGEGAIAVQLIHEYLSSDAPAEHAAAPVPGLAATPLSGDPSSAP